MTQPPLELNGARLICFAEVPAEVRPTRATRHRRDGDVLGPAQGLVICQYPSESSFYLFYCDEDWTVRTDTFHLSLEDAKRQAEFEYEGVSKYWNDAP